MSEVVAENQTQSSLEGLVGGILSALGDAVVAVERCDERCGMARIDSARTVEVARKMFDFAQLVKLSQEKTERIRRQV